MLCASTPNIPIFSPPVAGSWTKGGVLTYPNLKIGNSYCLKSGTPQVLEKGWLVNIGETGTLHLLASTSNQLKKILLSFIMFTIWKQKIMLIQTADFGTIDLSLIELNQTHVTFLQLNNKTSQTNSLQIGPWLPSSSYGTSHERFSVAKNAQLEHMPKKPFCTFYIVYLEI